MLKIVRTVAPTAEVLDMVIGSFFKENGIKYTSTIDYTPCIAGYDEFCEKRDLVYNLSEHDEKILRKLLPRDDHRFLGLPKYGYGSQINSNHALVDGVLSQLNIYATFSAPIEWYMTKFGFIKDRIINSIKSIDSPICYEDFVDGHQISCDKLTMYNTLRDAADDTGSQTILKTFLKVLPDTYIITRTICSTYKELFKAYYRIAYSMIGDNDSEELRNDPMHIMARWIRDLPCSFLINDRFPNNCSLGGNQNGNNLD